MKFIINTIIIILVLLIGPLFSQTPVLQFSSTTVSAGQGPRAVVLIDLDRDGNRDLAVSNLFGSTISLIFGDGNGNFTLQGSIATIHKAPHAIAAGDFNEDGIRDVVTANRDSNSVALFLGDGLGGLLPPTFFTVGNGPRWIAVQDFNDDSHSDLAVTIRDDDNITIMLGDGSGNFIIAGTYYTGDGPVPVAAADFNNDGFIDLAVGNDLANTLTILNGDGTGGFTLGSTTEVGVSPKNIALGDLNQDGISDLAVACLLGETVSMLFADGEGGFTDSSYQVGGGPFAVIIEDFDGDGKKDIALADGINDYVAILLNTGMGNFAEAQTFPAGLAPHDMISGDFNADGRPDLAVVNTGDNSVTILLNETPPQESIHVVSVIQELYENYYPDPIISIVNQPLRLLVTSDRVEHVNRLKILPWIQSTDIVRVGQILTVEFIPDSIGTFQIQNLGHGFTGDIIIVEDSAAVDARYIELGEQGASLIHSNALTQIFPSTIRVLEDIPLTIHNISLDDTHWVSILPWVIPPSPKNTGNVVPRNVTSFQFTPDNTGSYVIQHTVHGFSGTLIVDKPIITGVATPQAVPEEYTLFQNYPNPFNPSTIINYALPEKGNVELIVYDVLGNEIVTLVNEEKSAGTYDVEFNATGLPSGIYFYKLQAGNFVETKKMILIK